jgi:hypothetical protein
MLNKHLNAVTFVKNGQHVIPITDIRFLDYSRISELVITVETFSGVRYVFRNIDAIEVALQVKPDLIEGVPSIKWKKFSWFVHNVFAHPLMQILCLVKMYRLAFYIHDKTVPGTKSLKESFRKEYK